MDIHKNARLTLRSREALAQQVVRGMTLKLAAASFNVTAKTAAICIRPAHHPLRTPHAR